MLATKNKYRWPSLTISPPVPAVSQLPHVERVEFYGPQNAREHHTLKYELVRDRYRCDPVLRRGQPFYLAVRLNRQIDPAREKMYVIFKYGKSPACARECRAWRFEQVVLRCLYLRKLSLCVYNVRKVSKVSNGAYGSDLGVVWRRRGE